MAAHQPITVQPKKKKLEVWETVHTLANFLADEDKFDSGVGVAAIPDVVLILDISTLVLKKLNYYYPENYKQYKIFL